MEKTKDFKTLVIRNLEDNKDLVSILNEVINETDFKTGQSAIEYIIRCYRRNKIEIERLNRLYYERKKDFEEKELILQNKLKRVNSAIYHFKQFQMLSDEL